MRFIFILILLLPVFGYAQPAAETQLKAALAATASDTVKVRLLNQLSQHYIATDVEKSTEHAAAALALAKQSDYRPGKARAQILLARGHLILGEFDRGLSRSLSTLKIGEELQDSTLIMVAHNMLGIMYDKLKDPDKAIRHYTIAQTIASALNNQRVLSKIYNNLGNLHETQGNYPKALELFSKAQQLQHTLGESYSEAISLHNIGNVHQHLPNPADGLPYLFRSLELIHQIDNKMLLPTTLLAIGRLYLITGDTAQAILYAEQSFNASLATGSSKKISASADLMQSIYAAGGNYRKAYEYIAVMAQHERKPDLEGQQKSAAEITSRHQTEQRELILHKLEAEKEKQDILIRHQRIILVLSGIVLLLMLISSIILFISRKRLNAANKRLVDTNQQMQVQHLRISSQHHEIMAQASLLQQQNTELEQHAKFKNRIFSMISHDLRAPFNSLKGVLHLVQQQSLPAENANTILNLLEKEMETASAMLDNVLIWAKAQLQASQVFTEELDLYQVVQENLQTLESAAQAKSIRLLNQIAPGTIALADKERLNFIIRNLLSNSIKFTFAGGEVRLSARFTGTEINLLVQDTGKGISEIGLKRLFTNERYTTLGTQKEKGTGLGLKLSQEFVQSMNGSITVDSIEGTGTVISVYLPKAATPVPLEV